MHWIAPTEKDVQTETLEKRLWDSADTATRVSASRECEATGRDFRRAKDYWIALAEVLHGVLRVTFRVGNRRARQIGVFTGSARILLIAWLTIHGIGIATIGRCLAVIAVWLDLKLAFEIAFGWLVFRVSWRRIAADFDLRRGGLLALEILILFLSPLLAAKWRGLL